MRKQTKLVAVLSAAALLAMGASMTSFAAGWQKDDAGVWHYYDSDDNQVTEQASGRRTAVSGSILTKTAIC